MKVSGRRMVKGPLAIGVLFSLGLLAACLGVGEVEIDEPFYIVFDTSVPEWDRPVILNGFRSWSRAVPDLVSIEEGPDLTLPLSASDCSRNVLVRYTTSLDDAVMRADARTGREILGLANRGCRLKTVSFVVDRGATSGSEVIRLISGHEMGHILGVSEHHPESRVGLMSPGYPGVVDLSCEDLHLLCKVKGCNPYRYNPCSHVSGEGD